MKKRLSRNLKQIICVSLSILAVFSTPNMARAMDLDFYAQNNILFYDPDDTNCSALSAGMVTEDGSLYDVKTFCSDLENKGTAAQNLTWAAIIWNWFVKKNIPGVSNSPEVLAGILGNLWSESDFSPWVVGNDKYYGVYQTDHAGLRAAIEAIGMSKYWNAGGSASLEETRKGLEAELEFLYTTDRFSGSKGSSFINSLGAPHNRTGEQGAASYAELFEVIIERAVYGEYQPQDKGVLDIVYSLYGKARYESEYKGYQGMARRSENAKCIYRIFASAATTGAADSNTDENGNKIISEEQLALIRQKQKTYEEAAAEADIPWQMLAVIFMNDTSTGDELMQKLIQTAAQIKAASPALTAKTPADDAVKKGFEAVSTSDATTTPSEASIEETEPDLFTLYKALVSIDETVGGCAAPTGSAALAQSARDLAWPDENGMCTDRNGSVIQWAENRCNDTMRPAYKEALRHSNPQDCSYFVDAVVNHSGVDPNFDGGGSSSEHRYLLNKSKEAGSGWIQIENLGTTNNLQPGDILVHGRPATDVPGHILVYVGEVGGEYGIISSASLNSRTGNLGKKISFYMKRNIGDFKYDIFRYVGGA